MGLQSDYNQIKVMVMGESCVCMIMQPFMFFGLFFPLVMTQSLFWLGGKRLSEFQPLLLPCCQSKFLRKSSLQR